MKRSKAQRYPIATLYQYTVIVLLVPQGNSFQKLAVLGSLSCSVNLKRLPQLYESSISVQKVV